MDKLTRQDLYSLEEYATRRAGIRSRVMAHKKDRKVPIGPSATLYFEDRETIQYQIQEMLRAERIFEAQGIQEELDAYNPLIPDGTNWKATFMIEEPDVERRRVLLAGLVGVEDCVWVRVGRHAAVHAVADEDLDRSTTEKTASVHFLRFELSAQMVQDMKQGASLSIGIDHPDYRHQLEPVAAPVCMALAADLD